jgi:hypothetical protein
MIVQEILRLDEDRLRRGVLRIGDLEALDGVGDGFQQLGVGLGCRNAWLERDVGANRHAGEGHQGRDRP